jgi:hypothetical protein
MTQLRPFDILIIQTAIEEYRRKYPQRPIPSAEEALAWRLGRSRRRKQQIWDATMVRRLLRIYERLRTWKRERQGPSGEARLYRRDGIVR